MYYVNYTMTVSFRSIGLAENLLV